MAWAKRTTERTTKHTCGGPHFGRVAPRGECPRCDELRGGAAPVTWGASRAQQDRLRCELLTAHFASEKHRTGGCGPVCTAGEW